MQAGLLCRAVHFWVVRKLAREMGEVDDVVLAASTQLQCDLSMEA